MKASCRFPVNACASTLFGMYNKRRLSGNYSVPRCTHTINRRAMRTNASPSCAFPIVHKCLSHEQRSRSCTHSCAAIRLPKTHQPQQASHRIAPRLVSSRLVSCWLARVTVSVLCVCVCVRAASVEALAAAASAATSAASVPLTAEMRVPFVGAKTAHSLTRRVPSALAAAPRTTERNKLITVHTRTVE